jgi:hypothetical protein
LWKRLSSSCVLWKHLTVILTHVNILRQLLSGCRHVTEESSCPMCTHCNVSFCHEKTQQFFFPPVQFCSNWPSLHPLPNLHCTACTMAWTCNVLLWKQCLHHSIPSERFTVCPLWTRCKQFLYLLTAEHCCPV